MKCKYVILTLLFFINISTADQGSTELRRGPGYYITEDGNLYRLGCLPEIEMPTWIIPSPGIPLKTKYRSSIDLSENLPPIRSQGGQGSCVAWATGYYYKTYQEWQEHNWDVTTEDHQFSPAFIYNHINGGQDAGSYVSDAFKALLDLGCATWFDMPYTDENYTNLPDEETYFNAINYRCEDVFYINMFEDLESVKNHLLDSNLVVFCINIYEHFYDIGDHNYTYCVNTFYGDYVGGHCVTICGFDDDRPTEDGPGAFKIVNSWGPDWGDNGYFWMSYEAVQNPTLSQMWALYSMDKIDYNPTLISRHYVDHDIRGRVAFQFGIGEGSDPLWKKHLFDWFQRSSLPLPFPPTNVVVDLTDGIDHLSEIEPNNIYIRCKDERFFWHTSYEHAYEGKSWWCADEEIPGYDNGWLMFYETPNVTLGSTDNLFTFMLSYAIEEPGDYGNYDGWDAANVRISTDGFETWEVLNGFPDYDFTSGWGWGYNGEGENIPGWGGYHPEWQPATFDLSAYANETIQIRIAFGSDGAWCSRDDPTYFGIVVDDITIIGGGDIIFYDDAESRDLPGTIDYFATEHLDWNVLEISDETPITIPEGYEYAFANVSIQPEEPYDGPIWYVSTTGCDSTGDGSEENPFATIQFGIDTATENDTVLVAAGTYYENIIWPATNGIKLIGNGEEDCVIDGDSVASVIRFEENLGGIIDSTTVISNISIQNGFAHNEWETESGGGIFLYSSSPAIVNVLIKENFGDNGGGIACIHWSNPLISYVTIQDNLASYSGGGILIDGHSSPTVESSNVINNACYLYNYSSGGGIAINDSSNAQIKNVVLKNNEADYGGGLTISWESDAMLYGLQINNNFGRTSGGGMEIHFSNPIVQNCEIKYNSTEYYGGGIYVHSLGSSYKISPLFEGVVVHHNSSMHGGGLYSEHGPRCILRNSTLVNNTAEAGSGVYIRHSSYPRFINSIIWGNHDIPQVTSFGVGGPCSLLVAFTDVQGGEAMGIQDNGNCEVYWEEGNIFYYPDFIDSLNGDYNLLSDSPCIDAGTDFFVWEGDTLVDMTEDEYYGSAPDMGAFEYYGETLVQYINLSTGWNIFSTYFIPEDLDMLTVVQPLIDAGT
ncbi:MAG: DUF1565 domain-containing protein, partial [Candidatus Marinimicrobia bacterium]|nr:DUF1565 domain-containing protein [Candidatus Neomarinimicrobiota bacterium]